MILKIRDFLLSSGGASIPQIAAHCGASVGMTEAMLDYLQISDKVTVQKVAAAACSSGGCSGCPIGCASIHCFVWKCDKNQ